MTGTCRFCGCRDDRACDGGCWWIDRTHTVCSTCVDIDHAWTSATFARKPNMTRAFGAGFRAAEGLAEAANPYRVGGATWRYWYRGWDAGGGKSTGLGTPMVTPKPDVSTRRFSRRHP